MVAPGLASGDTTSAVTSAIHPYIRQCGIPTAPSILYARTLLQWRRPDSVYLADPKPFVVRKESATGGGKRRRPGRMGGIAKKES